MSRLNTKNILLAITNAYWFIDVHSAEQLGENVAAVLAGKDFWTDKHKAEAEFLIVASGDAYVSNSTKSAKPGSIAVVSINGPIMKYDNCGDPGSQSIEALIKEANANPNIHGLILKICSGGGEVSGTQSLSKAIKAFTKPKVTLAEDLMASAAYWFGSSTDYIFADTETAMVGSVGTMFKMQDLRPLWEARGIKVHEIYADESSEKNADYKAALDGNYDPLKKNLLNPLNQVFTESVKANRGDKLNTEKALHGQMYTAKDALKYGLIDEIGGLDAAINKINAMISGEDSPAIDANSEVHTQNPNNMKKITLLATHAAILALCGATIEAGKESVDVEMSDDLLAKFNAALADGQKAASDLVAANEKVTAAETAKTDSEKKVSDLSAEVRTLTAKVSTLENPGATSAVRKGDDEIEASAKSDYTSEVDEKLKAAKASISTEYK